MPKKLLPISMPSVTAYLHHANRLAISECDPRSNDFLINNFLNLYSGMGDEKGIDFYSPDGMYPRYPFIHNAWLHTRTLKAMGGDLVGQACGIIDSGCYVEALLDEFYISEKPIFGKVHFPHQNLIYGYCTEQQCFFVQGFNREFVYKSYVVHFSEFAQALRDDLGMSVVSRTDFVEHNNSIRYCPDLIRTQLTDFISSSCSFLSFAPKDSKFGIDTYQVAIALVALKNGGAIDIRPWCVFHEHKKKIRDLGTYLEASRGIRLPRELGDEIELLENDFLSLRNYLLEAKIEGRGINIDALEDNLQRISSVERDVIAEIIECVA
jgi:hypothetical protein